MQKAKAIVLLSGGLDSTTCLAYACSLGHHCVALSFDYGQRHAAELDAAKKIADFYQVSHETLSFSLGNQTPSALLSPNIAVPQHAVSHSLSDPNPIPVTIPVTYVPARNTIFLSIALGWAEIQEASAIFIGVSAIDYSGYPDCRPEYIRAFQNMANLATKAALTGHPVSIETPLITLSKADTIRLGKRLNVPYEYTISCYHVDKHGLACGTCDACHFRKKGFREAAVTDPTSYIL